ncbi:MAG TPA: dihydrolipoamide acetyltransferase family protein [Gaiellaceae bacterium]|nr:dihydrolipoamide acetyltransferase family protein [Gaiellaceae bacterium]
MASEIKLPRLGQGMESGTIVKWLKAEGERVEKGEPLYELDTDKVTQEVEADASGVLLRIAVQEGEVPVGRTIAIVGDEGEEVPAAAEEPEAPPGAAESAVPTVEAPSQAPAREPDRDEGRAAAQQEVAARRDGGRVKASPLARRIARERGIDLASLSGTGPEGRIVAEDVERAGAGEPPAAAPVPVGEVERRELTSIRRTIATRLTEAWQIPVFQLQASVDMSRANGLVARLREDEQGPRATVTDVLTKVCAAALIRHREVNAQWTEDAILLFPTANVGIAVATPQGLVVPVIRGAERLRLAEIAAARADLVARARDGKLRREDLEDGTFTISNLGMFRVERFTAVLNPPQAAIVAVGATEEKPVALDGDVVVRPMLTLSATFDHRAVDGAPAAEFLQTVKELLEEPGLML